jgi:hypothetical protein
MCQTPHLDFEGLWGGSDRDVVEGHVHHGRETACDQNQSFRESVSNLPKSYVEKVCIKLAFIQISILENNRADHALWEQEVAGMIETNQLRKE